MLRCARCSAGHAVPHPACLRACIRDAFCKGVPPVAVIPLIQLRSIDYVLLHTMARSLLLPAPCCTCVLRAPAQFAMPSLPSVSPPLPLTHSPRSSAQQLVIEFEAKWGDTGRGNERE